MMDNQWLLFLRCPHTGGELQLDTNGNLETLDGQHKYPVSFGIPDLRI